MLSSRYGNYLDTMAGTYSTVSRTNKNNYVLFASSSKFILMVDLTGKDL